MILESLSHAFLQFERNYVMNKLNYNMNQFLNELQTFESILKEKGEVNVTKAQLSSSSNKNRKRKKRIGGNGKSQGGAKPKKNKNNKKESSKKTKSKGKCVHCNIDKH